MELFVRNATFKSVFWNKLMSLTYHGAMECKVVNFLGCRYVHKSCLVLIISVRVVL